jgi:hypothetical protein
MKKGDTVTIYQDPLTKKNKEGQARLVRLINDGGEFECWKVRFLGGDAGEPLVCRFIKKK